MISVLLINCYTCMREKNQISNQFLIKFSTLEQYIRYEKEDEKEDEKKREKDKKKDDEKEYQKEYQKLD